MDHKLHTVHLANKKVSVVGLPCWSVLPTQEAWLRALVRAVDPTGHNSLHGASKDPTCCNKD